MKKSIFSLLALVFCAFATLSCEGDDENKENNNGKEEEKTEKYLTLPEQQEILGNLAGELAAKIDLTQLQEAIAMLSPIKELPMDDILDAAERNEVMGAMLEQFKEMAQTEGNVVLDLSKLNYRFALVFKPVTMADGSYEMVPEFELVNRNHDRFQIDVDESILGYPLSLWLKGEGGMTTVEIADDEDELSISLPKNIAVSLDSDGQSLFGAKLVIDTDLKMTLHGKFNDVLSSDDDQYSIDYDDDTYLTVDCGRFNLEIAVNAVQYALSAAIQYVPESGTKISVSLSDISSNSELLKIEGGLDGTFKKNMTLDEESILAWLMDSKSCRKLWADVSLLAGEATFKVKLDNPIDGIPAEDRIEYMKYLESDEKMPEELKEKLISQIMPYFDNGFYFKGYSPAQSKLAFVENEEGLFVVSCDPKSEESMSVMEFLLTEKIQESVSAILAKVLPIVSMFQSDNIK